jgi:dienelactone hydrolase
MTFKSTVEGGGNLLIPSVLYKPAGPARGAVVIVNGSYGWSNNREGHYARSMSSAGFAVLVIDTYAPRGVTNTGTDTSAVSMFDQLGDAYAARRALIDAGHRPDRIAIMGAGRGGAIALMAADRAFGPPEGDRSFALAMAVTPSCLLRPRAPKPLASVFIGLAEKDSLNGVQGCQEMAAEFAAAGGKVASKVYPGTASGFDGEPILNRMVRDPRIENLMTCKVVVEPDGRSTFESKSFAKAEFSALVAQMRRSCVGRGAFGYTNLTQKANVTLDLIDFLDSNFAQ